jgi:cyanobactin cluster PatC/TenC/TruC protein
VQEIKNSIETLTTMAKSSKKEQKVHLESRLKVLVFDANSQGIAVGSSALRPQGRFTIEAWVCPATNAGKQVIFADGETRFYLEGGELKFQPTPTAEAISSVAAGLVAGNWYHVVVARGGSRPGDTKLYINGVENDNKTAITPVVSFGNTYLGGYPEVPDSGFQGKLLEVRVWRFARSQAEIQANMTYFLTGRELGLVRCWTLNEGFGTAIGGKTTNGATGTVLGDATWEESEIPIKVNLNAQERLTRSTGLEDYGYWYQEMAKQQKTQADVPFRRGRIWA